LRLVAFRFWELYLAAVVAPQNSETFSLLGKEFTECLCSECVTIARNAVRGVDQQAAFIRGSMTFSEKALSNTFDFAHKLVRMKEPQEFAQIQTEFVSRQAQLLEDQTKEIGQIMRGVQDAAKTTLEETAESSRRRSEAA
jgi:hypothetical protein